MSDLRVALLLSLAAGCSLLPISSESTSTSAWSTGDTGEGPSPALPPARAVEVVTGTGFACALVTDGTVRCWGDAGDVDVSQTNVAYSHFGTDAYTGDVPSPVEVPGITDVIDIAADYRHVCVVTAAGRAHCWGENMSGQIGDGTDRGAIFPVELPLTGVAQIVVGSAHTCARLDDGRVMCWGSNVYDQLEDVPVDHASDRWAPIEVPYAAGATRLFANGETTCAELSGEIRCWGQLVPTAGGAGDFDPAPRLLAVTDVDELYLNPYTSCGAIGGAAMCWGQANGGNLGTGADLGDPDAETPVVVRGLDRGVTSVSAGCAAANGKAYCWGSWPSYLGDGSQAGSSLVPVEVTGLDDVVQVSVSGWGFSCAVTGAGSVYCWGQNGNGEIGTGSLSEVRYLVPQKVLSFE